MWLAWYVFGYTIARCILIIMIATVYGYFETLLQLGDISLLMQEMSRLKSFEDTMRMAGIDYDILVDMFDYTWDLFDDIRQALERHDKSESVILKLMNDENVSNSIVYHFKVSGHTDGRESRAISNFKTR